MAMFLLPDDVDAEEWEREFYWPTCEGAVCEYPSPKTKYDSEQEAMDELDRVMDEFIARHS